MGDINDISFTPLTFQEEEETEQNFENDGNEQKPENEMNDLPDLAPESEPEEESEENTTKVATKKSTDQKEKTEPYAIVATKKSMNKKISDKAQENNRPERKNRTVHDYSKLNKYGTTVIGNIRPEETEIKKGRRNVKISTIGNTIKVEKKETEKEK